ncbi:anaerobic ribonucleoside triphosphate reductase [Salipaludibacillus sp. LMS25]|uniref:anaerobic ribonucleoside triphosphate reductase n=1 Tax=Salipaludibacillus sp. LMS25 TaxID=2924031 RepID=UPI0020D0744D|nr:anaerobic ribonucleoside triphosphate reductase [Salipaludibacillus sp. LMS25]UTR14825.1 anaerobic ribonucleoside triphosphate reductase [Salipaludibacillus sp. LMS25]
MKELIKTFEGIEQVSSESLKENANVDGHSPLGKMNTFASEVCKWYTDEFLLSEKVKEALADNILYIHDKDFYPTGTTTCSQIPLDKLLKNGFYTGHGRIRPPKSIQTALALAAIILQSNQNNQHGGQSFQKFDYDLALYVRKSYESHKQRLTELYKESFTSEKELEQRAWKDTQEETFQACEAFIHNANSMHSRGGGQVPFVSINYGTDTSREGRLLIQELLKATRKGLGNGETPIFPIQIFKVKDGVNSQEGDPNYDLFIQAVTTTSRRLFPNFSFLDSPFNNQYFDGTPESEVAYMGCRTRVMGNIHGDDTTVGRGNISFSSLNLVRLALNSEGNRDVFWSKLTQFFQLAITQLLERYEYQRKKKAAEFPFLFSQGIWTGGDTLHPDEEIESVIKHGSLSVGFIGLAEALVILTGKHHGESEESWELGKRIIQFMRDMADEATQTYQMNIGVIATPAEGLSGKFVGADREKFGTIKGVTDKDFYTNSFHIPVYYPISIYEKIRREAPFHDMCNAGHITYVEVDGNASQNTEALIQIIKQMKKEGIGYGSINHPVDQCLTCGYQGVMHHQCPACGENDENKLHKIRRITGYLVGDMKRWNKAKRQEEANRVKHGR